MSDDKKTWSTREAAQYLGISTEAMRHKAHDLGAVMIGRGYRWPVDRVKDYALSITGKALTDPTR